MPRPKQFCEEEILNKAMELFWQKGFHATSMQDLVLHLGINRASLYDTFGGKEELFDKAFAHYRKAVGGWLHQLFDGEPSVKMGFKKLFDKAIEETVNDENRKGCFVVNTTTELIPGNKKMLQTLLDNKETVENLFIGYVQKGINTGELSPSKNAQEVGLMLFALYNGIRVLAKVDSNPDKLQKVVNSGLSVLD
ncbi:TetR/AcrR family transcriptional regulator [Allomuricauda sp. SCSIO 65647]|uniref:TetR/AcrR family transcriptional regulator n=1 Tax=Allomuricauda sp. SCSIO 65647 TaxID=2908843 RepID=UPI001F2755E8|nr:TetR/AcrR family transcriptional regulator [Muricauda sp. SCSIO 65647]UJH68730.1 TetR/AcrR family transcriptional regulator [Muricauda sp. SCSIO 65647]